MRINDLKALVDSTRKTQNAACPASALSINGVLSGQSDVLFFLFLCVEISEMSCLSYVTCRITYYIYGVSPASLSVFTEVARLANLRTLNG